MPSKNNDKIEILLVVAILTSVSFLTLFGKISAELYESVITVLLGYIFGRIINHRDGKE
jgi:hypothetical protein